MGCRVLELSDGRAVLSDSVTESVFGSVFESETAADEFCWYVSNFLAGGGDPRKLSPSGLGNWEDTWRVWSPNARERRILERIASEAFETEDERVEVSYVVQWDHDNASIESLAGKGLVEVDWEPKAKVWLTDLGAEFVNECL